MGATMKKRRTLVHLAIGLALLSSAAACGDDEEDSAGADNTLTISTKEYAFEIEGEEFHEIAMAKLVDGKSVDDVSVALAAASEEDENALEGIVEEESAIDDL